MKTLLVSLVLILLSLSSVPAQNVGIGTNSPHNSAALEISSSNKGVLIARMTTAQRNAIAGPATGLLVYDTDFKDIYQFNGLAWLSIAGTGGGGVFANTNGTVHNTGNQATDQFIFGRETLPGNAESLADNMFFFLKSKGAFRAGGSLNSTNVWRPDSVGNFSFAAGNTNKAKGESSMALGGFNAVSGRYAFAGGFTNAVNADYSTAFGGQNTIWGETSFTTGVSNNVLSPASFVAGTSNTSRGVNTGIIGSGNLAAGDNSFIAGKDSRTTGLNATTIGVGLVARSFSSIAMGMYNDSVSASNTSNRLATDPLFIIGNGSSDIARSNAMVILKNGAVGIGTNVPAYPLTVTGIGGKGFIQKTGNVEVGFYTSATEAYVQTWSNHPLYLSSGNGSPQMSVSAYGVGISIGTNTASAKLDINGNLRLRSDASVNIENVWAKHIRLDNDVNGADYGVMVYDGTMKFRNFKASSGFAFVNSNGSNVATLSSTGNLVITGTLTSSDERLKKNISHIKNPMEVLNSLNGYNYYWKDEWRSADKQSGLLAQEVERVLPELVAEDGDGIKAVNYTALIPYLLEAVKEIKSENEKLKQQINQLKTSN